MAGRDVLYFWPRATISLNAIRSSWEARRSCRASTILEEAKEDVDGQDKPGHDGAWLLLAVAFPAVFVNLGHGHNGFLTAALIGFALMQIDRRPVVAGVLFGLLAYKPQFGLMIPLVLLATTRWRALIAAAATVAALTLAVTLTFGADTWRAFFASAEFHP